MTLRSRSAANDRMKLATPMALLVLGMGLVEYGVGKGWQQSLTICAMKLVVQPLVVLGLSFQLLQTLFISLAWRNILRAAYPKSVLPYREVLSYYAGGAGLNSILPASAGTVATASTVTTAARPKIDRRDPLATPHSERNIVSPGPLLAERPGAGLPRPASE